MSSLKKRVSTNYLIRCQNIDELESFFGHLKDNLRIHRGLSFEHQQAFVKWYLHFNNEKKKKG